MQQSDLSQVFIRGENGAKAHSTAADSIEDFNGKLSEIFLLVRGESKESIEKILNHLESIIDSLIRIDLNKSIECMTKLIKITLFLREPRSGKGERMLFYHIVNWLWFHYDDMAKFILEAIKDFGYWGDFIHLYEMSTNADLKSFIVELYANQLLEDKSNLDYKEKISLAGKWAPREGSKNNNFAKALTKKMFKSNKVQKSKKMYRLTLSCLNQALNTTEPYMCQKHWSSIDFGLVPSATLTNLTKAFQDEKVSAYPKEQRKIMKNNKRHNNLTNLNNRRHNILDMDYSDRDECRTNLISHITSGKKISSKVANLTTIVQNYLQGASEDIIWEAQWTSRLEEIKNLINENNIKPSIFPMIDLSSSMTGSPMSNAITLGLFTSILFDDSENIFANKFMTFNTTPELANLPIGGSLCSKITALKEWFHRWGGSTNIEAALRMLLDMAIDNNVKSEDMPKVLAIFSDMQFDLGDPSFNETTYEMLKRMYEEESYTVPHIIFWNLKSNTTSFQVSASCPNVSMLSGYSPRMMDLFLTSNIESIQNENQSEQIVPNTLTLMEAVYQNKMFDKINDKLEDLFDNLLCPMPPLISSYEIYRGFDENQENQDDENQENQDDENQDEENQDEENKDSCCDRFCDECSNVIYCKYSPTTLCTNNCTDSCELQQERTHIIQTEAELITQEMLEALTEQVITGPETPEAGTSQAGTSQAGISRGETLENIGNCILS